MNDGRWIEDSADEMKWSRFAEQVLTLCFAKLASPASANAAAAGYLLLWKWNVGRNSRTSSCWY